MHHILALDPLLKLYDTTVKHWHNNGPLYNWSKMKCWDFFMEWSLITCLLPFSSAGGKVQDSYCYQIFLDQNHSLVLPTVQQLLEHSFHSSGLKLAEVTPPGFTLFIHCNTNTPNGPYFLLFCLSWYQSVQLIQNCFLLYTSEDIRFFQLILSLFNLNFPVDGSVGQFPAPHILSSFCLYCLSSV